MTPRIREAGPVGSYLLDICGFAGVTMPWGTAYLSPAYKDDDWLIRHEIAHLGQIRRDGWFRFWFWVCVWFVWPGYARSPYEIEAREAEHDPRHPLITWADHWAVQKEK